MGAISLTRLLAEHQHLFRNNKGVQTTTDNGKHRSLHGLVLFPLWAILYSEQEQVFKTTLN